MKTSSNTPAANVSGSLNVSVCQQSGHFLRRPLLSALIHDIDQKQPKPVVFSGLGSPTYDVAAIVPRAENFYFWGAMGLTTSVALGFALSQPKRRTIVVTGDAEMLMGLGSLATAGVAHAENLAIIVLDNEKFLETGGQPGLTSRELSGNRPPLSLCNVATASGFSSVAELNARSSEQTPVAEQIETARALVFDAPGPTLVVAKIAPLQDAKVIPETHGHIMADCFRKSLGL